jgi:hypothetical protein
MKRGQSYFFHIQIVASSCEHLGESVTFKMFISGFSGQKVFPLKRDGDFGMSPVNCSGKSENPLVVGVRSALICHRMSDGVYSVLMHTDNLTFSQTLFHFLHNTDVHVGKGGGVEQI